MDVLLFGEQKDDGSGYGEGIPGELSGRK